MPSGGYRASSRVGDLERWNSELLDEKKALLARLDNPFANLPQETRLRAMALDKIVERGARSYIDLGRALREIKEGRFFMELGYDTWEGYCIEKRNIAKSYAYYLVSAYEISTLVESKGLPIPATETHVRELSKLRDDPTKLVEAYSEFLELDETTRTASALRGIVQGYLPPREERTTSDTVFSPNAPALGPTTEGSGDGAGALWKNASTITKELDSLDSEGGGEPVPTTHLAADMHSSPVQAPADFSAMPDASNWTIDTVRQYTSHVNSFIRESAKLASKHPDRRIWLVSAYNFLKQVMETENLL